MVGVAIKDRGAILPAGHSATAAFWFDPSAGNWITSTYYMNELPSWAKEYNDQKWPIQYLKTPWTTLYPIETYKLSTADDKAYEGRFRGANNSAFPHNLSDQPGSVASTPWGNTTDPGVRQKKPWKLITWAVARLPTCWPSAFLPGLCRPPVRAQFYRN